MSKVIRLSKETEQWLNEAHKKYEIMNINSDGVIQIPSNDQIIKAALALLIAKI